MRTHGWGGSPPASDDEAITRILQATRACIDAKGASASITDVATALGVTRQTVYRYFPGTEDLLRASAIAATDQLIEQTAAHVAGITDPGTAIVEMTAFTLEYLHSEPHMRLLLTSDRIGATALEVTSRTSLAFGHALFTRVAVDWERAGIAGQLLDELIEHCLRMVQSLILYPGSPPRTGEELRRYLARWLSGPIASLKDPQPARAEALARSTPTLPPGTRPG